MAGRSNLTVHKMLNWKTWQLRMHCNLRPPDATQPRYSFSALRRHTKFDVAEPIRCRIIAFLLFIHYVTLCFDLWSLSLKIILRCTSCVVNRDETLPNLNAVEQSATELLRFQYLTKWPWTLCNVLCSAVAYASFISCDKW